MTSPNYHDQLTQFGESQLNELSSRDICASTVHLILATAFFTGAAIGLAKSLKSPKKIYLAALHQFMETHFRLNAENAKGMVESNTRLYKRYVLIDNVYDAGAKAALEWYKNAPTESNALKTLLTQYRTLSMSGLNIEGTKEAKPAPVEIETIAPVEIAPQTIARSPRWGRRLLWLINITLLGLTAFSLTYPELIPVQLLDILPSEIRSFLSLPTSVL